MLCVLQKESTSPVCWRIELLILFASYRANIGSPRSPGSNAVLRVYDVICIVGKLLRFFTSLTWGYYFRGLNRFVVEYTPAKLGEWIGVLVDIGSHGVALSTVFGSLAR